MTEQRLSDARLREIMEEHRQARGVLASVGLHDCCIECGCEGDCLAHPEHWWPCETRQMAEELIERRKPELLLHEADARLERAVQAMIEREGWEDPKR